jgi:YhcH/YjgK/YiaL family protein
MIFDELRHIDLYYRFSKPLKESFEFLRCKKFSFRDQQTCKIGAEGIYAIPQEYSPIKKEDRCIECHHRYIDIQVMVDGIEYLGYANKNTLHCSGYDEEHDTEQLTGALTFLPFSKNYFTVLFPQDAHMPGVKAAGSTHTVKKVVIKVPVELWE